MRTLGQLFDTATGRREVLPSSPCRSSTPATTGSYAERRITVRSPGSSQPDGARSAARRAAVMVDISCRSTAADPACRHRRREWRVLPLPCRGRSRPCSRGVRQRARPVDQLAVRCRGRRAVLGPVLEPPLRESSARAGKRALHALQGRDASRAVGVASTRPQLVTRRCCSKGSSRMNAGWVTPTMAVRVAWCESWIITAPLSGSNHYRSRAASPGRAKVPAGRGLHDPAPKQELPTHGTPEAAGDDWEPLDELAATDADSRERRAEQQDRDDVHQGLAAINVLVMFFAWNAIKFAVPGAASPWLVLRQAWTSHQEKRSNATGAAPSIANSGRA